MTTVKTDSENKHNERKRSHETAVWPHTRFILFLTQTRPCKVWEFGRRAHFACRLRRHRVVGRYSGHRVVNPAVYGRLAQPGPRASTVSRPL